MSNLETDAPLFRYVREYVSLIDLLDAAGVTDDERDDIHQELGRHYSYGDAAVTLADATNVARCIEDSLPDDDDRTTHLYTLLEGVHYVNLEN